MTAEESAAFYAPKRTAASSVEVLENLVRRAKPMIDAARGDYVAMEKRARRDKSPQGQRDADAFRNSIAGMDVARGILNQALEEETAIAKALGA